MADSLTTVQKHEYCQHKEAVQKQGNKFPFSVALEYCKNKYGVSPSSSTPSRIWVGRDQWESAQAILDKTIAAVLNKIMIERFRSKAQSTLDASLV
jgi:hypothetical protein